MVAFLRRILKPPLLKEGGQAGEGVGIQWRIQDFLEVGAPTPKVDVKSYYLANFFPKTG